MFDFGVLSFEGHGTTVEACAVGRRRVGGDGTGRGKPSAGSGRAPKRTKIPEKA
jgi:hypothetical protein